LFLPKECDGFGEKKCARTISKGVDLNAKIGKITLFFKRKEFLYKYIS